MEEQDTSGPNQQLEPWQVSALRYQLPSLALSDSARRSIDAVLSMQVFINRMADIVAANQGFVRQVQEAYQTQARMLDTITAQATRSVDISKLSRMVSEISSLVGPLDTLHADILQRIQKIAQSVDATTRAALASVMIPTLSSQILEQFEGFRRRQLEMRRIKGAAEAFREAGWVMAPSIPDELIDRAIQLHDSGKTRYVSQTILGYYRQNSHRQMVTATNRWRQDPLYAPRMHIIDDALEAHRHGKYTLSVPTLLAQVEGVLNDYVAAHHLNAKLGKIQKVYEAAIGDPLDYDLAGWAVAETLLFLLENNIYAYSDFEKELTIATSRRNVTRHTILHGIQPGYDKESHSLRVFLILDALSSLLMGDNKD